MSIFLGGFIGQRFLLFAIFSSLLPASVSLVLKTLSSAKVMLTSNIFGTLWLTYHIQPDKEKRNDTTKLK